MRGNVLNPVALAGLLASGVAVADGTYGAGAWGGNFQRDENTGATVSAEHETGGIGAAGLGYAYRSGWRPELEYAYRTNDNEDSAPDGEAKAQALIANLWYDLRFPRFTNAAWPYAGLGVGSAAVDLDGVVDGAGNTYSGSDTVLAFQAGLGFAVQASPRTIFSVGYRYFETEDVQLAPGVNAPYRADSVLASLRYDFGGPRASRRAEAPPQAEVAAFETLVLRPVNFQFDRAELTGPAQAILDELAARLAQHPNLRVVIEGHTDAIGSENYNMGLGQRRADAAAQYLVQRGVPRERVETVSRGETEPIADNTTPEGRATNRRAEIGAPQAPPQVKIVIEAPSAASVDAADDALDPGR